MTLPESYLPEADDRQQADTSEEELTETEPEGSEQ